MEDAASLTPKTDDMEIQKNEHLAGKYVYGRVFWGRLPYIKEHFRVTGLDNLMEKMVQQGYNGPQTIREIKKDVKYPVEYLSHYNRAFMQLYGEEKYREMARDSAKRKGIVSTMAKWAGTPVRVLEKAPGTWKKFYAFGRLETKVTGETKGIIRLYDGKVDELFCKYLTNYFTGIGEVINYDLNIEHTKCVLKGDDHSEWEISWGKDHKQISPALSETGGTAETSENGAYETEHLASGSHLSSKDESKVGSSTEEKLNNGFPIENRSMTPNERFNLVISELEEHVGDILALGITKVGLERVGSSVSDVTENEMIKALHEHIKPSLHLFMSPDKANDCVRSIVKKFVESGQGV